RAGDGDGRPLLPHRADARDRRRRRHVRDADGPLGGGAAAVIVAGRQRDAVTAVVVGRERERRARAGGEGNGGAVLVDRPGEGPRFLCARRFGRGAGDGDGRPLVARRADGRDRRRGRDVGDADGLLGGGAAPVVVAGRQRDPVGAVVVGREGERRAGPDGEGS